MGWMTRFEPATSGSTDRRSNQLSYIHHKNSNYIFILLFLVFFRQMSRVFPCFCK